ncbi:MAG: hypothetical protein ACE5GN_00655 [Waddliaceae bacterium]
MASKKTRKEKKQQIKEFLAQTPQEDYDRAINKFFRAYGPADAQPTRSDETSDKNSVNTSVTTSVVSPVPTPVVTPVASPVTTSVDTPVNKTGKKHPPKREHHYKAEYLDATHSASEQKVYSILYRESKNMESNEIRIRISEMIDKTGLSDKTVRTALHSLENKLSIAILERSKSPYGRPYRIYDPKKILERRKSKGLKIDPVTKQIRNPHGLSIAPVATSVVGSVNTSVGTPVAASPTTSEGASVRITEASSVEITDDDKGTPYINKNKKIKYLPNKDTSSKEATNKTESSANVNDSDDKKYNHKRHVRSLYEKYTLNSWKVVDDETYENIKDVLPDVIESAIIASVLRCKTKVNSLAYCEGAIREYVGFLPPGYVNYLREKWNEIKRRET